MKTYLVTGGAGFLGSHLCERLLRFGHKVIVIDNLTSSSGDNLVSIQNLYQNQLRFIKDDITNNDIVTRLHNIDIDGIFNLACPASPPFYQSMPIETMMTCVQGTYNVLKLARERGIKILQTSTSEVYGDPHISPQHESYRGDVNCYGPRACYDEGKRAAEALIYDFQRQHNIDARIVRIFNTYGPNMLPRDGRVVSNFIVQALKGEDITIYGTGHQSRSFCYVDDLIDMMFTVWDSDYKYPVNIGNPNEYSMNQLAELVMYITGSNSKYIRKPLPVDDPMQRCPDIDLIKSLGWSANYTSLDIGLETTVQYFRELQIAGKL